MAKRTKKYDPVKELHRIRTKYAKHTTEEIGGIMKKLDKKKHKELMRDYP